LIVVGIGVFLGLKVIPVRVTAYEFHDVLREECRFGATRDSDQEVVTRILTRAKELEVPLKKENLSVQRTTKEMVITARYEQPIDLKVTTYTYRFDQTEKAPLF
jgi:hypothetical protein